MPGAPGGWPPPGEGGDGGPTWRRWSLGRILAACALVLLLAAIASAVWVLEEVHTLGSNLAQNGVLKVQPGQLAPAAAGAPQTLLLVGDDQRSLTKYYHVAVPHLANEMLLVRIDPSKPYISMMSIPRELWVPIHTPSGGTFVNRINAAYTYGIGTLVSTIKQDIGLSVNHVVVITFGRFKRAVDQMGCVYSTVDRRYFHVNVPGGPQYQEINLQPGYQKLCGTEALQFVSYRHGDTSQVRDARDQAFLLDVKKQYGPTLVDNIHKFEHIFGQAVQTDPGLQSTGGILDLLDTLISSSGRRVRQVHFQANLLASYDTASPQQIQASVHAFLFGGSSALPTRHTAQVAKQVHKNKQHVTAQLPMVATPPSQLAQARGEAANLPFPLEYPRVQDRGGAGTPVQLRGYLIHAPDGSGYPAYAAVFATSTLGQFYDVQGTTWRTAPLFDSPDQTVTVGGRTYYLFYEADHLRMVAWYEHGAVYWIRNSLTDSVDNGEMLAIAEQTEPFTVGTAGKPRVILQETGVPTPTATSAKPLSLRQKIGGIGGLVAIVALPLLVLLALRRRRELVEVRHRLQAVTPLDARVSAATAHIPDLPITILPLRFRHHEVRHDPHRSGSARTLLLALLAIAVIGGAGTGIYFLVSSGQASTASSSVGQSSATNAARSKPAVPSLPVTVLNSGSAQGAASSLSVSLRSQGVKVVSVGNVREQRPPGIQVLYVPGQHAQAELLAHLLSSQQPTVAPIDPVAQAAAGPSAQLVIVIS